MIRSRAERIQELMKASDKSILRAKGISLIPLQEYKPTETKVPVTAAGMQLEATMRKLHKLKMKMYAEGKIK